MRIPYDRVYADTEKSIIQIIFQKLTFTPSISLYKMATIAIINDVGKDKWNARIEKDKNAFTEDINVVYRRFNTLLSCFADETSEKNESITKPLRKDKIYDENLKDRQLAIYDDVAERVGFPTAEKSALPLFEGILSPSLIQNVCGMDKDDCPKIESKHGKCSNCTNCQSCNNRNKCAKCDKCKSNNKCDTCPTSKLTFDKVDVDLLAKYAPYYYHGERDGLNFLEHIIYQAIYSTKQQRDIVELGKLLSFSHDTKSAKLWLAPVFEKIDSVEMYKSCVDTFFEIFYDYVSDKYDKLVDEYIRILLLPEEYAHAKDALKAFEKHVEKRDDNYNEYQLQRIIERGNWYDIDRAFKIWNATDSMQYLIFHVMPHVWKILIEECDKSSFGQRKTKFAHECLNFLERDSVAFYCRLIKDYIHSSLQDSKIILRECFRKTSC